MFNSLFGKYQLKLQILSKKWYERTDIQNIRPVKLDALNPQNFWNHWDRIGERELEEIAERFFQKIREFSHFEGKHFLFDTTNFYTYMDSRTVSELTQRGHNKSGKHHLRQVGLALVTERSSGLPVYYRLYPGNQHDSRFFNLHIEEILKRREGVNPKLEPYEVGIVTIVPKIDSERLRAVEVCRRCAERSEKVGYVLLNPAFGEENYKEWKEMNLSNEEFERIEEPNLRELDIEKSDGKIYIL